MSNTLVLQHTIDPQHAFDIELARLRAPTADAVANARRAALAEVIERAQAAWLRKAGAR